MTAPRRKDIETACQALAAQNTALSRAYADCGEPVWRSRPLEYATLASLVVHQLISLQAAASIEAKLSAYFGEVTAEMMLTAPEEDLRACGLSRPKIAHMKAIAEATLGPLDLALLPDLPLAEARKQLLAIRGIGPWTADLVALYCLGAMDVLPPGDVGLMESYKRLSGAQIRHASAAFSTLAEGWTPYRGVAAHLLWAWLHFDRAREKETR